MQKTFKILAYLKNKYVIALLVFLVLIIFYDRNDIFVQMERADKVEQLHQSKAFYEKEIEKTTKELNALESSQAAVERYAREQFFMTKDHEVVFIVDSVKPETPHE